MRSCQLCVSLPEKVPVARGSPPAPSHRWPVTVPGLTRYTRTPVMFMFCDDVNLTPSSTPGPARLPSPPSVQQKLFVSREKLPQSVCAAVNVEDHKPGTLVPAADADCVTLSAASANTLSAITTFRTRTSIPLCTARANAGLPRDSARKAAPCARGFSHD